MDVKLQVRLDTALHEELVAAAKENHRSLNSEIIDRLRSAQVLSTENASLRGQVAALEGVQDDVRRQVAVMANRTEHTAALLARAEAAVDAHLTRMHDLEAREKELVVEREHLREALDAERARTARLLSQMEAQVQEHDQFMRQQDKRHTAAEEALKQALAAQARLIRLLGFYVGELGARVQGNKQTLDLMQHLTGAGNAIAHGSLSDAIPHLQGLVKLGVDEKLLPESALTPEGRADYAKHVNREGVRPQPAARAGSKSGQDDFAERQGSEPNTAGPVSGSLVPLRPHTVELELTREQAALVEEIAREKGIDPSVVLRQAIMEAAGENLRPQTRTRREVERRAGAVVFHEPDGLLAGEKRVPPKNAAKKKAP